MEIEEADRITEYITDVAKRCVSDPGYAQLLQIPRIKYDPLDTEFACYLRGAAKELMPDGWEWKVEDYVGAPPRLIILYYKGASRDQL